MAADAFAGMVASITSEPLLDVLGVVYAHLKTGDGGDLYLTRFGAPWVDLLQIENWYGPGWFEAHRHRLPGTSTVYRVPTRPVNGRQLELVVKNCRVGEEIPLDTKTLREFINAEFNSPFEAFAAAQHLTDNGVPTVYVRAIYMTGSAKIEPSVDLRRFESHRHLHTPDGQPILRPDRNYITIRGFYNGPDSWVATHDGQFHRSMDIVKALARGILDGQQAARLFGDLRRRLAELGYDDSLLGANDVLIALDPTGALVRDGKGEPELRVCNFEQLVRRQAVGPTGSRPGQTRSGAWAEDGDGEGETR